MTDPEVHAADSPAMEPDRARGVLNHLLSDLPGVVYRRRNDHAWTMVGLTENVEDLTGYPVAELVGNARLSFGDLIVPEDRHSVWKDIQKAVAAGSSFRVTYRIRTRSGEERWVLEQGRKGEKEARDPKDGGPETQGEQEEDREKEALLGGYIQDISGPFARRLSDSEARREEMARTTRLLQQTLSSLGEAVFVIGPGGAREIAEANEAAERIFGYPRGELIGATTEMLHRDGESFVGFGEESLKMLLKTGVFRARFPMRRKDGTIFAAEQTVTLLDPEKGHEGGAVSVLRDVSERKEVEARLRESEERFRQIAEHIDAVFWIHSPQRDVVEYVSPAYQSVWGYPPEELYEDGLRWREYIHPEDREGVLNALSGQVKGAFAEEYRIIRSDGEVRWIRDRAFPVKNEAGEVYRVIGVAEDITERRALGEQLRHAQRLEGVGRLAGGIAHDFNNLLTVIRGQSDLLHMDLDASSPLLDEVLVIQDAADRAADLTSKLLAFSRDQVLRPRIVDLNRIIQEMEQLLRRVLGEDIQIETRLAEDLPPVRVDPGQMEHVVMNLALNARDAMPNGGVLRLSTSVEEVTPGRAGGVPGFEGGLAVRIAVVDTGVGMDDAIRQRVFDPFFTTKEKSGGTGLGLAMVYGTVQQSGGVIQVESEPGKGTLFVICFPPVQGEVEAPDRQPRGDFQTRGLSGRVLVVEDDPDVRAVAHKILARGGLEVRTAEDAETGIRFLEAEEGRIDLVLTDLVLPKMKGRELVDLVRDRWPGLPIIVMSGYAEGSPGARKDLPLEVAFIPKPFTPEALLRGVGEMLERA
jgi:two-component system, cell cycle sensor histidine kinase and response regulator CckA